MAKFNVKIIIHLLAIGIMFSMPTLVKAAPHDCCDYAGYNTNIYKVEYDPNTGTCKGYEVVCFGSACSQWDWTAKDAGGSLCAADETCLRSGRVNHPKQPYPRHLCYKANEIPANVDPSCNGDIGSIRTALGCINTSPDAFAMLSIRIGIGIGSGIAFLLILLGSFRMVTSQGNPEGIGHAKETITSAVIGLVFIILSVTLIQIIGFDILGLGNLGLSGI